MPYHELDNLKMDCDYCQEIVIYGDDYINHLKEVHGIKKNFAQFLDKKIKNGEKRKAEEEVIDIDDDDEEDDVARMSEDEEDSSVLERQIPAEAAEKIKSALTDLFAPLYEILDEYSEGDLQPPTGPVTSEYPEDEELLAEFNKFSRAFNNLKFPEAVIRDLVGDQYFSLKERPELPVERPVKENPPRLTETARRGRLTPTKPSGRQQPPPPPATPSSTISSTSSSNTTLFFCPLPPCQFKTSKEGMKDGVAAKHLKEEHRVTGAMMKKKPGGTYRFRKVKQEL